MPTPPANQPLGHERILLLLVNEPFVCQNVNDFQCYHEEQDHL